MGEPAMNLAYLDTLPLAKKAALLSMVQSKLDEEKIADYRPYTKQNEFFSYGKVKRERLFRAGNQQGKTLSAACEVSYHLTGEYPDWWQGRTFDRPVVVWASGETGEATRDNPQRALLGLPGEEGTGMIPARCITDDHGMASGVSNLFDYVKIRHKSGRNSLLRFKYYAQGRRKWQGPPIDVVWFDEEPPQDIYDEGLARTIATGGMVMLTFTPLLGMSEVVRRFLLDPTPERADINMTIDDADHIPPEDRQKIINSFPEHEREARARGVPTLGSGRIFPIAESRIKVQPFPIPKHWPQIGGIDFGWDHPTAAVKMAWDRDTDCIYVTHCYRQKEQTPVLIAATLKAWGLWLPWSWPADGYQHEKGTGRQLKEQYREQGLKMLAEHAQFPDEGDDTQQSRVSVEAGVMQMLDRMQTDRWKVFDHLEDWFDEYRLYHREDGKIVKEYDDLMAASRYAMMMLRYAALDKPTGGRSTIRPARNWRAA